MNRTAEGFTSWTTTVSPSPRQLSVLDAKILAEEGRTGAEIKAILEQEALDATIYIAVDTLEYLKKGGRITPAAAAVGSMLRLKPVLTIQGDKLDSFAKARGMKSAFHTMLNALKRDISTRLAPLKEQGCLKVGLANTSMDPEKLEAFKAELHSKFPRHGFCLFSAHHEHRHACGPRRSRDWSREGAQRIDQKRSPLDRAHSGTDDAAAIQNTFIKQRRTGMNPGLLCFSVDLPYVYFWIFPYSLLF